MSSLQAVLGALALAVSVPTGYAVKLDRGPSPILAGARVGTIRQAVSRFGAADRVVTVAGARPLCAATWGRYRLEIRFTTTRSAACAVSDLGAWWQVTMRDLRWHTRAGLHVGDPAAKLQTLYPAAVRIDFLGSGTLWELETGGPLCDGGPPLALAARTRSGHVASLLVVHVPACG